MVRAGATAGGGSALNGAGSQGWRLVALSGGYDFFIASSTRRLGQTPASSSLEPFVYSAALENGFRRRRKTIINDAPVVFRTGGPDLEATANNTSRFYGPTSFAQGLVQSRPRSPSASCSARASATLVSIQPFRPAGHDTTKSTMVLGSSVARRKDMAASLRASPTAASSRPVPRQRAHRDAQGADHLRAPLCHRCMTDGVARRRADPPACVEPAPAPNRRGQRDRQPGYEEPKPHSAARWPDPAEIPVCPGTPRR